ncbi:MAG TPA: glycosyltransferase family 2 protein [Anaerolineaceae bacterium]|jgi:glycosyltransferase involved in cell wall biosynthesis|nr:glycosyltransferase family 2 protein [Chloroflexota bacterium]HNY99617.1 glycosyltransferase family 2 protein [Anaerolineaceae bacterium]HOU42853.1 glycosyltransferase family 2 protein [Anaerolineaceae bacterium]HQF44857.1 glycosyltransferase family 2 protein [Anaerolineaceae bacterium]HQH34624.1 glycosyltransferase family 2 protein [Anaerolineaceae bacterium]
MASCSIVIRAYNEEKHLPRLLTGIQQQTIRNVQVILVDSGSTDQTAAIARQYGAEVVYIQPQEFTFGRSLNRGVEAARSDLVVTASAHVYPVYPDWLERLLDPFVEPKVALTYGKQRGAADTHFSEHQIFRQWFPDEPQINQAHPFCNNANAAIRRTLWQDHPYDELLTGLEDLAWARWAQTQGHGIRYVPEAEVIHVHHETWHGIYNRYRREAIAFKQIYPQETFTAGDFFRLLRAHIRNDWQTAWRERVFGKVWLDVVRFRWQQLRGTYTGYRQSGPVTWQLKKAFYYPRWNHEPPVQRDVKPIDYQQTSEPEVRS